VPAIREYVRSNLGETYVILTKDGGYDGTEKPDIFGNAIDIAMRRLFVAGTEEDAIDGLTPGDPEIVKAYVAAVATRRCIPAAIDYVQQRMGQSDRIGTSLRGDPLASGETRTFYDRINGLQRLDGMLARQIQDDQADFEAEAASLLRLRTSVSYGGPAISSISPPRTTDPNLMPSLNPRCPEPFTAQWSEVIP
jgi:hypothetical protein